MKEAEDKKLAIENEGDVVKLKTNILEAIKRAFDAKK